MYTYSHYIYHVHIFWLYVPCTHIFWLYVPCTHIYDYMPKGVQEKRTDVLGNKIDRMWLWVSNAFSEWTHMKSSTSEGRRQYYSSFREIWPSMWFVTKCWTLHITTSPHHCAANHAVNCKIPSELTRCDPHEYYQVNCCCSVSHRIACSAWVVAMDNVQHTANLEHF